jgi:hypothetical protein
MKRRTIVYRAIKVVCKPTVIKFSTRDGRELFIKGIITEEVELDKEEVKKQRIKMLRKAGLPSLAKLLKMV